MSVVLRPWGEDDAEWYAAATRDDDIQQFTTEGDVTGDQMRTAIRRLRGHEGAFCIADETTSAPLGNIGWKGLDEPGAVEGYYWVAADARGRGVASTALELLWDAAVGAGTQRMQLVIRRDNVASRRTARSAGFAVVATRDESVVFERCS